MCGSPSGDQPKLKMKWPPDRAKGAGVGRPYTWRRGRRVAVCHYCPHTSANVNKQYELRDLTARITYAVSATGSNSKPALAKSMRCIRAFAPVTRLPQPLKNPSA